MKTKKAFLMILMSALGILNAYSQLPSYVPTNGLVGYWPFNGNANDESGNGNNGTVNGVTLTADRFENTDKAFSFNGLNNYIGLTPLNLSSSNEITISIWVKPSDITSSQDQDIIRQTNGVNTLDWLLCFNSYGTKIKFGLGVTGSYTELIVPINSSIYNNSWHHLIATYDGAKKSIYCDGVILGTETKTGNITYASDETLSLGSACPSVNCSEWYPGIIDDIAIYNRDLTQQEITAMYLGCSTTIASITPAGSTTFCQGGTVVLNASTGTGYSYEWYKNGAIING